MRLELTTFGWLRMFPIWSYIGYETVWTLANVQGANFTCVTYPTLYQLSQGSCKTLLNCLMETFPCFIIWTYFVSRNGAGSHSRENPVNTLILASLLLTCKRVTKLWFFWNFYLSLFKTRSISKLNFGENQYVLKLLSVFKRSAFFARCRLRVEREGKKPLVGVVGIPNGDNLHSPYWHIWTLPLSSLYNHNTCGTNKEYSWFKNLYYSIHSQKASFVMTSDQYQVTLLPLYLGLEDISKASHSFCINLK